MLAVVGPGRTLGPVALVVGFDLDMTLFDTRAGIAATYRELVARTGVPIDVDLVVSRLGPPLTQELANWFPADEVPAIATTYRSMYPAHAIAPSTLLPGAAEAVEAVRAAGGRVVVITSKYQPSAELHLEHAGLIADALVGDVFADGKARALRQLGAAVYVGDHVADMRAAGDAGVVGVGVSTGPCAEAALLAAGARVVLPDLIAFPAWFAGYRGATAISVGPAPDAD